MNWYMTVLRDYATFTGRAHRAEYWMFFLVNLLISIALMVVDGLFGLMLGGADVGVLQGLYGLLVLLPSLAVAVRRLHDTGRSGWWVLLLLIPVLGALILLVLLALEGEPGPNDYGVGPRALPTEV